MLVLRKSMPGDTVWTNAVEIFDTFEVSVAMVLPGAGEVLVTAVVMGEDQPVGARSCTIVHTGVALEAISVARGDRRTPGAPRGQEVRVQVPHRAR